MKQFLSMLLVCCIITSLISSTALASENDWQQAYKANLQEYPQSIDSYNTEYTLYDIDKDGIPELIIKCGIAKYYIYTFEKNKSKLCGEFYWVYSNCLYENDDNGIIVWNGGMGPFHLEYISLYVLSNGVLEENSTIKSTEECSEEALMNYLENCKPIDDFYPINDDTLFNSFYDVPSNAYYFDSVSWAVENGITTGTSSTTFSPETACTRAQMVTFLWRAAGSPAIAGANFFKDVSSSDYFYNAVLWAVKKGITNGTSPTTFAPNATITRGQTVTFLYRHAASPAVTDNNPFTDVATDAYYAPAVQWAAANNITNGTTPTTFSPNANCTRGQIVTFLYRYMA